MKWTGNDTYNAVMTGDYQSYGLPTLICVTCTESRVAKVDKQKILQVLFLHSQTSLTVPCYAGGRR